MTRIQHVTLIVTDLVACREFYEQELGLKARTVDNLDYPGAFLMINDRQELHLAELPDYPISFRGHFCLRVTDFSRLFWRMLHLGVLDTEPWGCIRELPNGSLQLYVRDPSNNLIELNSEPGDRNSIDERILRHPLFTDQPYRYQDNEVPDEA